VIATEQFFVGDRVFTASVEDVEWPTRGSRDEAPDGGAVYPADEVQVELEDGATETVSYAEFITALANDRGWSLDQARRDAEDALMDAAVAARADRDNDGPDFDDDDPGRARWSMQAGAW